MTGATRDEMTESLGRTFRLSNRAFARQRELIRKAARLEQPDGPSVPGAEPRFRGLFDAVLDAIFVADESGRYVDANRAAELMLGFERDELLQMRMADIADAGEHFMMSEFASLRADGYWRGEADLRRKDGSIVSTEIQAVTLSVTGTNLYVAVVRDISRRREAEQQQNELLAGIVHELRNPLTPIIGMSHILLRDGAYDRQAIEDIHVHALRLERILRDLLDATRIDAGGLQLELKKVDLVTLVTTAAEEARTACEAHEIKLQAPVVAINGLWDGGRLLQVLQNLLSNAIRYSPGGGEIGVRVERMGGHALVAVTDRGVGIPAEDLPFVFDRFYRTEQAKSLTQDGSGLGLHVARNLIEAHGGHIWGESAGPGRGSRFSFLIPCSTV